MFWVRFRNCMFKLRTNVSDITLQTGRKYTGYSRKMDSANDDHVGVTPIKPIAAVCQMCSSSNKRDNFKVGEGLIRTAIEKGACMVFLPECFDYMMKTSELSVGAAELLDGELMTEYTRLARECGVWLSLGGFHHRPTKASEDEANKMENLHVIIDNLGEINATYAKVHMFDVDIAGKVKLKESDFTTPGTEIVPPVDTPIGKIGLQICYDMRFPESSLRLRCEGADILTFPSAFTQPTGQAHWESLLRSRAIENQCYVIAAAQVGTHNEKRSSHGHAMIIDPWGKVVADCSQDVCVRTAEIDLDYVTQVRSNMPVALHRRPHLYSSLPAGDSAPIDDCPLYTYGHVSIQSTQVFYVSALTYACVNIKPVLPGHVLVVPLRRAERFVDLSPPEVNDLFVSVQRICTAVQKHFDATSVTVAIQDGPDSGQTVKHVHVHIIPRRPNDLPFNDDIYNKLQTHDADMTKGEELRTEADMKEEATALRVYFREGRGGSGVLQSAIRT